MFARTVMDKKFHCLHPGQSIPKAVQEFKAAGLAEKIGEGNSRIKHKIATGAKMREIIRELEITDHRQGLTKVVELLTDAEFGVIAAPAEIQAVGHRVVHGGDKFSQPTVITTEVRETIKKLIPLAPLPNPANLTGIEVATEVFPEATQVAVFDTAFHQTMPASHDIDEGVLQFLKGCMGYHFLLNRHMLTDSFPDSHLLDTHAGQSQAGSRRKYDIIVHSDRFPFASRTWMSLFLLGSLSLFFIFDDLPSYWG